MNKLVSITQQLPTHCIIEWVALGLALLGQSGLADIHDLFLLDYLEGVLGIQDMPLLYGPVAQIGA